MGNSQQSQELLETTMESKSMEPEMVKGATVYVDTFDIRFEDGGLYAFAVDSKLAKYTTIYRAFWAGPRKVLLQARDASFNCSLEVGGDHNGIRLIGRVRRVINYY